MKVSSVLFVLLTFALAAFGGDCVLSDGWQFCFDGSSWREVEVPHDWAIAGPFDAGSKDGDTGKLPWRGVGKYRISFVVQKCDVNGTVALDFDGVMARPKVYVNGNLAGGWDYGYQSFRVDATPFVKPGANLLEVVADTSRHRSRWYPGGGINRKVVLKTMPKAHFVYNGIAVTTPVAEKDRAVVQVRWDTTNAVADAQVKVRLLLDGVEKGCGDVLASKGKMEIELANPQLWDVVSPCLYYAECTLSSGNETVTERVRFGIRKIAFPVGEGANADVWEKNGFHLVYDKDIEQTISDGFFYTVEYESLGNRELLEALLRCGIIAIPLNPTGSGQSGIRVCVSRLRCDDDFTMLDERLKLFTHLVNKGE